MPVNELGIAAVTSPVVGSSEAMSLRATVLTVVNWPPMINRPFVRARSLTRPLAPPRSESSHVFHLFVVRCSDRDALASFLTDRGIETLVHYPIPAHRQQSLSGIRHDPRGLPHAERHAKECLSIPCHPQLRDDEVAGVIAAVNAFE